MAQYGVVLVGFTAGVLAYQRGVLDSGQSQPVQNTVSSLENKLIKAEKGQDAVKVAPQLLPCYETLVTCPRF
ncbi:unnamed protein product [Calypogeia fissa]